MGMVEELGVFLDAGSTRFSLGSTSDGGLFLNYLPDEPARAALLVETPGLPPTRTFAPSAPAWENARVQVVCRAAASPVARADAQAAWDILEAVANQTVGSTAVGSRHYLRVSAVQSVYLLDRDEFGRVRYTASFDVMRAGS